MLARYVYTGQLARAIVAREEADMLAGLARLVSPAADRMWPMWPERQIGNQALDQLPVTRTRPMAITGDADGKS